MAIKSFLVFVVLGFCMGIVQCYPQGAPAGTVLTMFPKHQNANQQRSASPFVIQTNQSSFSPSDQVNISLHASDGREFIGIILVVHRQSGDREEVLGSFTNFPQDKLMTGNFLGGEANYITHKNNDPVSVIRLTWNAPDSEIGNVTFRATFLESFRVFWWNVTTELPSDTFIQQPISNPVTKECKTRYYREAEKHKVIILVEPITIDHVACGVNLGCLLYPIYCSGPDCTAGVTFSTDQDNVTFQMWANAEHYVSIGFSGDMTMGEDETITCVYDGNTVSFQHGYNPSRHNDRQYKMDLLSEMASTYVDGMMTCSFRRPYAMNVSAEDGTVITFDLHDSYHLMVAWGDVFEGTDVMAKHNQLPVTSSQQIQFNSYDIYRGKSLPLLTNIHGVLMLVAWVLFGGATTIVSRYFKHMSSGTKLLGTDVWFQVHRGTAVLTVTITAASSVLIFMKVEGLSKVAVLHSWLGIAVISGVTLQVLGGLLRPGSKSCVRPVFNWLHFILGKSLHIAAALSCFVIFNTDFLPAAQQLFGTVVTTVWVVLQVVWEMVLEICKYSMTTKASYCMKSEDTLETTGGSVPSILLFFYITTMVAVLFPLVMAIFFF
ncbi:ferric-chelate reductase 1-like [Ylistrum balloti]|uniref:ferric-chelate reductase 1-like n=1 Tax=Ylistrum balloti TaxID=509963 RepID=UPI002905C51E|nr:ferric-chelate reductase 1-like [Ylistrum balloti]